MRYRTGVLACVTALATATTAHAATFTVDDAGDAPDAAIDGTCATAGGACTLRAAIEESEANDSPTATADTVQFTLPDPSTIQLTDPLPLLEGEVDLVGPGASALTVRRDTGGDYRIFTTSGDAAISGLTITNGLDRGDDFFGAIGGGVVNAGGKLTLDGVAVVANTVEAGPSFFGVGLGVGGGVGSFGELTVRRSAITENTVDAQTYDGPGIALGGGIGGIFAGGLLIEESLIANNAASGGGFTDEAPSAAFGGGLGVIASSGHVVNSTISGNTATGPGEGVELGGGIAVAEGELYVTSSTLAFNDAAAGANLASFANAGVHLRNTILSNPIDGVSCATVEDASIVSHGFNMASDDSCGLTAPTDHEGVDPGLLALADNGGPTQTHALPATSAAIDQGSALSLGELPPLTTDQRGEPRPFDRPAVPNAAEGDGSDIGAYELTGGCATSVAAHDPVGCWRFDEEAGTDLLDSSGNDNHGSYLNGPSLNQTGIFVDNTAASFDGTNDLGRIPDSASLDVGSSLTAEGWIKRSSTAKTHAMFNKGGGGLHLVVMNAGAGSQVFLRKANGTTLARSAGGIPADNQFHHVVATTNGPGDHHIYIDGTEDTITVNTLQAITDTTLPLFFSTTTTTQATFDEFALYDQALDAQQIADLHAAGAGSPL